MYKKRYRTRVLACVGIAMCLFENRDRSIWVKEYRQRFGHLPLLTELRENFPDDFKNYLRMDSDSFDHLLKMVHTKITKQDTVMRKSLSAEERLAATLRFLATGRSFEDLKFSTGMSTASLSIIIPETCKAIFEVLKEKYMKFPTAKEEWNNVARGFKDRWQFINCGGALDGKHIRIVPPPHSGATYYNYKNFYSIVLLALVNSNYEFIYVDVCKNGRLSDGGVLEYTDFYQKLHNGGLNLPCSDETVNNFNFVFIGDEAFSLNKHFLKPYPQRELDYEKKIFNYRLSRARNVVENTFGVISSRFRILHTPINMKPKNICYVILAICSLHNYLRNCSRLYITSSTVDSENLELCNIQQGEWRKSAIELVRLSPHATTNVSVEAKQNRENYKTFFNSDGKVSWQDTMLRVGRA